MSHGYVFKRGDFFHFKRRIPQKLHQMMGFKKDDFLKALGKNEFMKASLPTLKGKARAENLLVTIHP